MASTVTLSDARTIRELRAGREGAFLVFWNAQAPAVWAALSAVLEPVDAQAWAHAFRADLPQRLGAFTLEEPLADQVADALLAHVAAGDAALAERLEARMEVFHAPAGPAPVEMLLHAPGGGPRPSWVRRWAAGTLVGALLAGLAVAVAWRPAPVRWPDVAARHDRVLAGELIARSDPEELATALSRAGVRGTLTEAPDLTPEGLALVGAAADDVGRDAETVALVYTAGADAWTLQHTHAPLPSGAADGPGDAADQAVGALHLAAWTDDGGTWVLCGPLPAAPRVRAIRARRAGM